MRHALVFGASGQIGQPLLGRLRRDGWWITAVSREEQNDAPGLHWLRGDFAQLPELPARVEAIFSCGPLDGFANWYARSRLPASRIVAFGSTSVDTKRGSSDPEERDVATRLREAEALLYAEAAERDAAVTVLRPTLVYGAGRDATLSRIAEMAQRWGRFVLPRNATGLRQPVHVDDLAAAAFACVSAPVSHGRSYALPGGETLSYRDMIARVLAVLEPPPKLIELPSPLFNLALLAAQAGGHATGLGVAAVRRMRNDLVFDDAPARADFGYAPRPFRPERAMFDSR
ncbi:NAD-dependent epimerase/dehydratase family protein [Lysobacter silvisoli]|uniref:Nucleoside-diphosphate sugar epimerase n=1 Tax=Lysobacter silvisoli TaxID=2293254 RepID=A0A371JZS2_9GAMM|nr:NAD-dependent epimerase/dehydratase family protein [Lysobacter silvisoli]RDZ27171.1 nucleoside-diphosphate sugar epimerase [Lysobacter silvisoli]